MSDTDSTHSLTVSWTAPTENVDDTGLTNLAGYEIYYGTSPTSLTNKVSVDTTGTLTYVITNLTPGTWYFAVIAVNTSGIGGPPSATKSRTI